MVALDSGFIKTSQKPVQWENNGKVAGLLFIVLDLESDSQVIYTLLRLVCWVILLDDFT